MTGPSVVWAPRRRASAELDSFIHLRFAVLSSHGYTENQPRIPFLSDLTAARRPRKLRGFVTLHLACICMLMLISVSLSRVSRMVHMNWSEIVTRHWSWPLSEGNCAEKRAGDATRLENQHRWRASGPVMSSVAAKYKCSLGVPTR